MVAPDIAFVEFTPSCAVERKEQRIPGKPKALVKRN
jgi:hypothetical protein